MITMTKLKNPTERKQFYEWVPKHGLWLQAGQEIEVEGIIQPKKPKFRRVMEDDITERRIEITSVTDPEAGKIQVPEQVKEEPAAEESVDGAAEDLLNEQGEATPDEEEGPIEKKTVELGHAVIEEIKVPSEPIEDTSIPGVQVVDEDDQEPVYDMRGNELPPEEVVEVKNLHDIDPEDILAKNASMQNVEEVAPVEEKVEEPVEEIPEESSEEISEEPVEDTQEDDQSALGEEKVEEETITEEPAEEKVTLPSKSAMKKLGKDKVVELATVLEITDWKPEDAKTKIIDKIIAQKG